MSNEITDTQLEDRARELANLDCYVGPMPDARDDIASSAWGSRSSHNYTFYKCTLDRLRDARESLKWLERSTHEVGCEGAPNGHFVNVDAGKGGGYFTNGVCTCGLSAFIDSRKKLLNSK